MPTSASIVTTSGRFRDNRRGMIRVEVTAADMAEIVITQPPSADGPATTTRIVLAGDHLDELVRDLGKARKVARRLESVAS